MVKVPQLEVDGTMKDWTSRWLASSGDDDKSLIALICWNLWQNMNNVVWEKKLGTVDSILFGTNLQLSVWKIAHSPVAQMRQVGQLDGDGRIRWAPPRNGWLKANVDAAIFPGGDGYCIGIIVRDEMGSIVQARNVRFHGNISPRLAEAIGIRRVLS
ncbi:uncharacterized protein LOC126687530 [Mercurialis annua]|uniref:uncharacterized protein LOC126687530 n=1 Tax=Mercurialis annua TaxID=3986 RepID=UPI0021603685|nr:uncharacterized protein LOC126687530 [Mercurialis annua]